LRIHTQRSACLTLCGSFKINDSNGEYAIYYDAVYNFLFNCPLFVELFKTRGAKLEL
jgi:hypothetical protein